MENLWIELSDGGAETAQCWARSWAGQHAAVTARYAEDAARLALEKELRAKLVPLCGLSVMPDPRTGLLINISEWVARGANR